MKSYLQASTLLLSGCANWPVHENVDFDHEGLPAELSVSEALSESIAWSDPMDENEYNDKARIGTWIPANDGWYIEGTLSGVGWDSTLTPDFTNTSDCDEPLAFPPLGIEPFPDSGDYVGDIEWISLMTQERGTLCMSIELDLGTIEDFMYDIFLYRLNGCWDPVEIELNEEMEILGVNSIGEQANWWKKVDAGDVLGLVLAAYEPDEPELEVPWKIALSLIDIPTEGICPTPPWR
jgi:hypothetical protein